VHKILIRTSHDFGGSNSTSSITRDSPDFLHIAAVPFHDQLSIININILYVKNFTKIIRLKKYDICKKVVPLHLIGFPIYSLVMHLMIGIATNEFSCWWN
jgi:hypothetical protein